MAHEENLAQIAKSLQEIANHLAPQQAHFQIDHTTSYAYVLEPENQQLRAVPAPSRVDLGLLQGIDQVKQILLENTVQFSQGMPANNALLWGARGMGKSSLIKAIHGHLTDSADLAIPLALVEIQRQDISAIKDFLPLLKEQDMRFVLFCDDLSFDYDDSSYKSLKSVLDGGLLGRPENVLFYATSNRRHLMPRDMIENEQGSSINPSEAAEEKISLSDRFGLWLGFHKCDQATYLQMISGYCEHFAITDDWDAIRPAALEWAVTRGNRSGRVAWQFVQDLRGKSNA